MRTFGPIGLLVMAIIVIYLLAMPWPNLALDTLKEIEILKTETEELLSRCYEDEFIVTAYSPDYRSCGKYADGFTSNGSEAKRGCIAVDKEIIPMESIIFVPGYGIGIANDVGSAIKGKIIDICYDTHEEAIKWGKQKKIILIIRKKK